MPRREFIGLLGGAVAAWPLAAAAYLVWFLAGASPERYPVRLGAFHNGLKDAGYVGGQNIAIAL
jgi:putative tryptophan/tyrosine transport system substrate-binding protein